jgi:hypothetical protein
MTLPVLQYAVRRHPPTPKLPLYSRTEACIRYIPEEGYLIYRTSSATVQLQRCSGRVWVKAVEQCEEKVMKL